MSIDVLLSRLDGVKKVAPQRWLARCPTHDDRRASLSVRVLDDDRVLVHDFGGCAVIDILTALGLTFDALYPDRAISHHCSRESNPIRAADIVRALAVEALVVSILARHVADGRELEPDDHQRLIAASEKLLAGIDAAGLDTEGERLRRQLVRSRAAATDTQAGRGINV